MPDSKPSVLTPTIVEPKRADLMPAIRADLEPFLPVLRGAAQLITAAIVADFAARYAAPALVNSARQIVQPAPQRQTILVEEQTTTRRRVTVLQ